MVTVVDAANIAYHWDSHELQEQIAFANVVLINKTELCTQGQLDQIRRRIRQYNPLASLHDTSRCMVPFDRVIDIGAFDLQSALQVDPELLSEAEHDHEGAVSSASLRLPGTVDSDRFNRWINEFVQNHGPDLYRVKGILDMDDSPRRFVFQGVHMVLDGRPGAPWEAGEERINQIVFIGRNLDERDLIQGFRSCLAPEAVDGGMTVATQEA